MLILRHCSPSFVCIVYGCPLKCSCPYIRSEYLSSYSEVFVFVYCSIFCRTLYSQVCTLQFSCLRFVLLLWVYCRIYLRTLQYYVQYLCPYFAVFLLLAVISVPCLARASTMWYIYPLLCSIQYFCPEAYFHICTLMSSIFMSVLRGFLSSCLYSVVFYLHFCTAWSSIFISVFRGLLSSCLYSVDFYLLVCTPWSSLLMSVLLSLLYSCLYSLVFYLHVCTRGPQCSCLYSALCYVHICTLQYSFPCRVRFMLYSVWL